MTKFKMYNLSEEITKSLSLLGYESPTKVQTEVIPLLLRGKDIIVKSKTGSGKTAAFAIPLCDQIVWEENKTQVLVLAPTRELALQIQQDVIAIGRFKRIKCSCLIGHESFQKQFREVSQKNHVTVGTPGRILDHLERGTLDLSNVKYLIIDEADEMMAMGFIDQVEEVLSYVPKHRVSMMLSATMNESVVRVADRMSKKATLIEIEEQLSHSSHIEQYFYSVDVVEKKQAIKDLLVINNPESAIIFCNTQLVVEELHEYLQNRNFSCERIHGGLDQKDRTDIMKRFRKADFRFLVATDVAARGIDIDELSLVANYDFPLKNETYQHRIGRTARIGNKGGAVTLVSSDDLQALEELELFLGNECVLSELPSQEILKAAYPAFEQKRGTQAKRKQHKNENVNQEILRLHINAGKKTKLRAVDVVGALCSLPNMSAQDIGIIQILDISCYVEILNGKGTQVLTQLQNTPIKGRQRRVSVANDWLND